MGGIPHQRELVVIDLETVKCDLWFTEE